jgi:hypothetical protein
MKKYSVKEILKLATYHEYKVNSIKKEALGPLAGVLIGTAVMAVPGIITSIVDKVRESKDIAEDIDKILTNLQEYKASYGFESYASEFDNFTKKIQELKSQQSQVLKLSPQNIDETSLAKIQNFITLADTIAVAGGGIIQRLNELKGFGGKTFDLVEGIGLNLGMQTNATHVQKGIASLSGRLEAMTAPLKAKLIELQSQVEQAEQKAKNNEVEPSEELKAPEEAEEAESSETRSDESVKAALSDPELQKALEEIGSTVTP